MACVPAPPLFWYKPETLGIPGSVVTEWADSSGNGYDLTLTVGSPTVSFDPIPGVVFTTRSEILEGTSGSALNLPDGYTIFLVVEEPGTTSHTFMGKSGDEGGWAVERRDVGEDNLAFFQADYDNPNLFFVESRQEAWPGPFTTDLHIYMMQMVKVGDVGSLRLLVKTDGELMNSQRRIGDNEVSPPPMPAVTNTGPLRIGDVFSTNFGIIGTLKEVMGYAGELSDGDQLLTHNYLRNKYSISQPQRQNTATPSEVGRVSYTNTWAGITPPLGTQAGDVSVLVHRYQPSGGILSQDSIDFANNQSGVRWFSNLPSIASNVGGTGPNGTAFRVAYRVHQAGSETTTFGGFSGQLTPVRDTRIDIVTYRGLQLGASGAPETGNDLPPLGFWYQDETSNFAWAGFEYQPPVNYSADPMVSVHPNGMLFQYFANDTGLPSITSTLQAEGPTAQIEEGSGDFWFLLAAILDPAWESTDPLNPPSCAPTYNCTIDGCVDPGDGTGTYSTLEACLAACGIPASWNCVDGTCVDPGDGSGEFDSLFACEMSGCGTVRHTGQTVRFGAGNGSEWWVLAQLSDSGNELRSKTIKSAYVIGKVTNANLRVYRFDVGQPIDVQAMEDDDRLAGATREQALSDTSHVTQSVRKQLNVTSAVMHTIRVSGDDRDQPTRDRVDQITYEQSIQGVRR